MLYAPPRPIRDAPLSRCLLIAELATGHGGDLAVATDMIAAAADSGCDLVKLQTYSLSKLNPNDPQRDWLTRAHLDEDSHVELLEAGERYGIEVFSTPFDTESLAMLRALGLTRFKVASSEAARGWWQPHFDEQWLVSYPWGKGEPDEREWVSLTAIPLYPTPLECVGAATLLDGWSDHGTGIAACQWAVASGATVLEAHFTLGSRSRQTAFDKTPGQFRQLRDFADSVATIASGVATQFRERWAA